MAITIGENRSKETGKTHLFLDTKYKGFRKKEKLGISFKTNPSTEAERRERKEARLLAQQIARQKEVELLRGEFDIKPEYNVTQDFVAFAAEFILTQSHLKELKKYRAALNKLIEFAGKSTIPCFEITEAYLNQFVRYMERNLNGETPSNYFKKLKQIIKAGTDQQLFRKNPTERIKVRQSPYIIRDVLNSDELRILLNTPIRNAEIIRAFLFCSITGLRFCDVSTLKWKNIEPNKLSIVQQKTRKALGIPMTEDAFKLLGNRKANEDRIFDLPSHAACMKWLRKWMLAAGIEKKITWHCARHSFGTNLIESGVDVVIASKLLGHSSIVHTQRYVKVAEKLKEIAINKLPTIF